MSLHLVGVDKAGVKEDGFLGLLVGEQTERGVLVRRAIEKIIKSPFLLIRCM